MDFTVTNLFTSSADWAMKKPTVLAVILLFLALIDILVSPGEVIEMENNFYNYVESCLEWPRKKSLEGHLIKFIIYSDRRI